MWDTLLALLIRDSMNDATEYNAKDDMIFGIVCLIIAGLLVLVMLKLFG